MTRAFWFDSMQVGAANTDGVPLGYNAAVASAGGYTSTGGPFNDRFIAGLNGTRALGINAGSVSCGVWHNATSLQAANIFQGLDGATAQFSVRETATGTIEVRAGGSAGTILGTSAVVLVVSTWQYIEIEVTATSAGGSTFQVWVDGTSVLSGSGDTAAGTANNFVTNILNGGNSNSIRYEGLYNIAETAASTATRLGPVKPYALVGTADGAFTAWTANTGTRWQAINETPTNNGDTTYISSNTPGDKNSIAITDTVAGLGTIFGLAHYYWERRDDAGPHTVRAFLRDSGGTIQNEATETSTASFVGHGYFREFSPFTGGATRWTTTEVDGLQLGEELIT